MSKPIDVTVFSTPNCFPCRMTKRKLTDMGVKFTERDVTQDEEANQLIQGMGYKSVPVVLLGTGEHWQGFDPGKLEKIEEGAFR